MRLARPTAAMTGILALAVMAGCDDGRDYPSLLPTDQVLAQPALPAHAGGVGTDPAAVTDALMARRAALQAQSAAGGGTGLGGGDLDRRAAILPDQRENPEGNSAWTKRARLLQARLIERWAAVYA